jgi:hypothetical protein
MAATTAKKTDDAAPAEETLPPGSDPDVVETEDVIQMTSLRKDGTPDQTPGFKFLDPVAGPELLALQQESLATGTDQVREQGREAIRAASERAKGKGKAK